MTAALLEFENKESLNKLLKIAKIAGIYAKQRSINSALTAQRIVLSEKKRAQKGFVMGLIESASKISDAELEEINAEIAEARRERVMREKCFA